MNEGGQPFKEWKQKELDRVTGDANSTQQLPVPPNFFQKLCSREDLKSEIAAFGKGPDPTLETLGQDENNFNAKIQAIQVLLQAVKSSMTYYRQAKNSRDRHIENRQKAQTKIAAKQKECDESKPSTAFGKSKYQILDACLDMHPAIAEHDMSSPVAVGDKPWIIRQHAALKDSSF